MCVNIIMFFCECIYVCMHAFLCVCIDACMHVFLHVQLHLCFYACLRPLTRERRTAVASGTCVF